MSTLNDIAERLPNSLIALDFDGPIAPIVARPEDSRPVRNAAPVLHGLASLGATIAIVTGRDVETLLKLSRLEDVPGLIILGVHGAQQWYDGQLSQITEPEGLVALRGRLPGLCAGVDDGVWIEDKGLSLVLHARAAQDPAAALDRLRSGLETVAAVHGLELHGGKMVLEVRVPGIDKGTAMNELLNRLQPSAAVFAGDDLGDLPAMAALCGWTKVTGNPSLSVAVGEHEAVAQAADIHLDDAHLLMELLSQWQDRQTSE